MIDIKRNKKGEFLEAKGIRTRASSIYTPNQKEDFKLSRSKFSDFLSCKRCFYLDRVKGLDPPGTPGWTLNETTDLLLKKEFGQTYAAQESRSVTNNKIALGTRTFKYKNKELIMLKHLKVYYSLRVHFEVDSQRKK